MADVAPNVPKAPVPIERPSPKRPREEDSESDDEPRQFRRVRIRCRQRTAKQRSRNEPELKALQPEGETIRCVCGTQDGLELLGNHPDHAPSASKTRAWLIQCGGCNVWQHRSCVGTANGKDPPKGFYCEQCSKVTPTDGPLNEDIGEYTIKCVYDSDEDDQPPAQSTSIQAVQQPQANASFTSSYASSAPSSERVRSQQPLQAAPPTSNSRPPTSQSSLSRLNTGGDLHVPTQGASAALQLTGQHPLQQTQTSQQQEQPSSPLYFHHWQPPGDQGKSKDKEQGTPSGRSAHTSPNTQPPGSHLRSEYTTSPKKRKATGSHQPAPAPSSHTSPSFNHQGSSGSTSGRRRRQNSRASDSSSRAAHESGRQSLEGRGKAAEIQRMLKHATVHIIRPGRITEK